MTSAQREGAGRKNKLKLQACAVAWKGGVKNDMCESPHTKKMHIHMYFFYGSFEFLQTLKLASVSYSKTYESVEGISLKALGFLFSRGIDKQHRAVTG